MLGSAQREQAWAEGEALSLEQAIDEALGPENDLSAPADDEAHSSPTPSGRLLIVAGDRPGSSGDPSPADLTRREREVAALIARGHTNRQIAAALVITDGTAHLHVVRLLSKLGFHTRAQVAAWAVTRGLTADGPT
jgi:DNA-binding NarL/FixJ family response regulator